MKLFNTLSIYFNQLNRKLSGEKMFEELIKLADILDSAGLEKEADEIDAFIQKISQLTDQEIQSIPENAPQKPQPVTQRQDYNQGRYFSDAEMDSIIQQIIKKMEHDPLLAALLTRSVAPLTNELFDRVEALERTVR
jgi:hypothetical protein